MDRHTHWLEYALLGILLGTLMTFAIGTAIHVSKPLESRTIRVGDSSTTTEVDWRTQRRFPGERGFRSAPRASADL